MILVQLQGRWPPGALETTPLPDIDAMVADSGVTTDRPFLLIGVLSSKRTFRRRVNVRNTWLQFITHKPTRSVLVRFVLSPDEVRARDGPCARLPAVGRYRSLRVATSQSRGRRSPATGLGGPPVLAAASARESLLPSSCTGRTDSLRQPP